MNIWLTLLGMSLVTLATRTLPLFFMRQEPPNWVRRWLNGVPVAVFTALALRPLILSSGPDPRLTAGLPLVAGIVGAIVAWRTSNVLATIIAGLLAYWGLRALGA